MHRNICIIHIFVYNYSLKVRISIDSPSHTFTMPHAPVAPVIIRLKLMDWDQLIQDEDTITKSSI